MNYFYVKKYIREVASAFCLCFSETGRITTALKKRKYLNEW